MGCVTDMEVSIRRDANAGFQLLEMMIICALIGLLGTIGWGNFRHIREHYQLRMGCAHFVSLLSQCRLQAVSKGLPLEVRIHPDRGHFTIAPEDEPARLWRALPAGMKFTSIPKKRLTFYSRGTAAPAGSFRLENRTGQIKVLITPTGRIRWQQAG